MSVHVLACKQLDKTPPAYITTASASYSSSSSAQQNAPSSTLGDRRVVSQQAYSGQLPNSGATGQRFQTQQAYSGQQLYPGATGPRVHYQQAYSGAPVQQQPISNAYMSAGFSGIQI